MYIHHHYYLDMNNISLAEAHEVAFLGTLIQICRRTFECPCFIPFTLRLSIHVWLSLRSYLSRCLDNNLYVQESVREV